MEDMVHCRGCGKEIHKTAMTCPHCGASQRVGRNKSKLAAGLLAIFIGGLGVHRFYLGQWWGIFYLLFWITGLPSLVSIIEGIVFLATNNQSWDDKYNNGMASQDDGGGAAAIIIAVVVGGFFFIFVIGILAAIAIPAYQDYIVRAHIAEGINLVSEAKLQVSEYAIEKNSLPADNTAVGLPADYTDAKQNRVTITQGGVVILEMGDFNNVVAGETIEFVPQKVGDTLIWSCTAGSLPTRYRPLECR